MIAVLTRLQNNKASKLEISHCPSRPIPNRPERSIVKIQLHRFSIIEFGILCNLCVWTCFFVKKNARFAEDSPIFRRICYINFFGRFIDIFIVLLVFFQYFKDMRHFFFQSITPILGIQFSRSFLRNFALSEKFIELVTSP